MIRHAALIAVLSQLFACASHPVRPDLRPGSPEELGSADAQGAALMEGAVPPGGPEATVAGDDQDSELPDTGPNIADEDGDGSDTMSAVATGSDTRAALEVAGWKRRGPVPLDQRGVELANRAASLVGFHSLSQLHVEVTDDCVGFVRLVYESLGIDLFAVSQGRRGENGVTAIWRRARAARAIHQRPRPGDIVFFHETYDRNHDGKRDDGLTHVGIVESVAEDGTVTFVHRGNSGIHRSKLNLRFPRVHRDRSGEVVNDILRPKMGKRRAYTAGELFSGFATPERL